MKLEHIDIQQYPITDSHCHLSFIEEKDANAHHMLQMLATSHRMYILDVAVIPQSLHERTKKYAAYNHVYFSAGLHPGYYKGYTPEGLYIELDAVLPHAHAVGESGLDYVHRAVPNQQQEALFKVQLELAAKHNKPIIVHARDSIDDVITIIQSMNGRVRGVMHCFTGTIAQARTCIDMGFYISFAANISYTSCAHMKPVVSYVPETHILAETDAPYLMHQEVRKQKKGRYNHPLYLPLLYNTISTIRNIPEHDVAYIIYKNFHALLDIPFTTIM